jgi:hypothetical protein
MGFLRLSDETLAPLDKFRLSIDSGLSKIQLKIPKISIELYNLVTHSPVQVAPIMLFKDYDPRLRETVEALSGRWEPNQAPYMNLNHLRYMTNILSNFFIINNEPQLTVLPSGIYAGSPRDLYSLREHKKLESPRIRGLGMKLALLRFYKKD